MLQGFIKVVKSMNVIFTCGGTGGHISPAIAVANLIKEHRPDADILFVGAVDGMEADLVPRAGFRLETVQIASFWRKPTPKNILHNIKAISYMISSRRKADQIIRDFRPDVIVGKEDMPAILCCIRGPNGEFPQPSMSPMPYRD